MTARRTPDGPDAPAQPMNRAQRRGQARKTAPAPAGHGKVHGSKYGGPAPRQYQVRKHG